MKSFLKHTLFSVVFLAGLMALLMVFSYAFTPKDNTKEAGIDEYTLNGVYAEPENTLDVIFEGDSTSYYGINPLEIWRDTGITSYAAGSPQQYLCYTRPILEKIYRTQTPKYVFLEATSLFYRVPFTAELKIRFDNTCKIIRYHDRWKSLKWDELFAPVRYTHRQREKGYHFETDIAPADTSDYIQPTDQKRRMYLRNRRDFDAILELCQSHGTQIILFSMPNTTIWTMKLHNGAQAFADEMGLTYLDLNMHLDEMGFDWSHDTMDHGNHLNVFGADKVSKYLANYMRENLELTDHRSDDAFSAWNEDPRDYDQFKQEELRKARATKPEK